MYLLSLFVLITLLCIISAIFYRWQSWSSEKAKKEYISGILWCYFVRRVSSTSILKKRKHTTGHSGSEYWRNTHNSLGMPSAFLSLLIQLHSLITTLSDRYPDPQNYRWENWGSRTLSNWPKFIYSVIRNKAKLEFKSSHFFSQSPRFLRVPMFFLWYLICPRPQS